MFTRSSVVRFWLAAAVGASGAVPGTLWAQPGDRLNPDSAIRVNLASGAPVSVVSTALGDSRMQARGGAMVLDLHATLLVRNNGAQNIRGITMVVLAQEMTPGGKGSVAVP